VVKKLGSLKLWFLEVVNELELSRKKEQCKFIVINKMRSRLLYSSALDEK
jgi:hypothetical protein